ncbi:MAG: hypothetical protein H7125_08670 [Proteobacteria bacterium]|nr:hypothetical protein [Burkholderiales bacterium]
MLDWLSKSLGMKKKSTHPLASAESLREILDQLPTGNGLKALAELGDWLAMTDRPDLDPADRIHAIRALDERSERFSREVMFDFLSCAPTHHRAEQTWFTLTTYLGQAFDAYRHALRDLFEAGRPQERDKATATLFAARALHAITERKKLMRMRYRAIEPALWSELYGAYQTAEQLGVARKSVKVPGSAAETSAYRELLAALWLELAPISNLDHMQMEYLDRVVRELLTFFTVREAPDADTPFVVDLAQASPPMRWSRDATSRMSQRFLGPGQVYAQLVSLVRTVRRTRALPVYLTLEGLEGVQSCVNLVEKLILHWSKNPPRRVHDRAPLQEPLEVVHGYREIRRMIAGIAYLRLTEGKTRDELSAQQREEFSRYGFVAQPREGQDEVENEVDKVRAMIEAQNRQMTLEWLLTDQSEFGCGAIALGSIQWMQVGILLGLRWGGQRDWRAGVVRRLSRNAKGQATVGVQRFPGVGRCARIGALDKRQVSVFERSQDPGVSVYFDAIALLEDRSVLVEPGVYADNARFRLVIDGKRSTIKFLQLLERGVNFEQVRFELEPESLA